MVKMSEIVRVFLTVRVFLIKGKRGKNTINTKTNKKGNLYFGTHLLPKLNLISWVGEIMLLRSTGKCVCVCVITGKLILL